MQRIKLKNTDLEVSKIGFGTGSLHHLFFSLSRREILSAALDGGITHFDTARLYGNGIAEKELSSLLGKNGRHNITIATKVGFELNSLQ